HPGRVLRNIHRALRPGGTFLMFDIKASSDVQDNVGVPFAPYLYTVSMMHCMSVSLGLDGDGLGTCWAMQLATSVLAVAGFGSDEEREVDSDPINYYYIATKCAHARSLARLGPDERTRCPERLAGPHCRGRGGGTDRCAGRARRHHAPL